MFRFIVKTISELINEDINLYKEKKAKEEKARARLESYKIMESNIESARVINKAYNSNKMAKLAIDKMFGRIIKWDYSYSEEINIYNTLGRYSIERELRSCLNLPDGFNPPEGCSLTEATGGSVTRGEFDHISGYMLEYLHECVNMVRPYDNHTSGSLVRMKSLVKKIKDERERYWDMERKSYLAQKNESLLEFNVEIYKHVKILSRKRKSLQFNDDYGFLDSSAWEKEKERFLGKLYLPTFWKFHNIEDASLLIDAEVDNHQKLESDSLAMTFSDSMSPYDYETFCSSIMSSKGWNSRVTKGSGDQGVDVIATKNGVSVAIQCKMFNQPVGNAAVQEVFAGSGYYDADLCAVVTNNTYTTSARKLASKLNVMLIHHDDLYCSDDIFLCNS